jgi:hypothetical protein
VVGINLAVVERIDAAPIAGLHRSRCLPPELQVFSRSGVVAQAAHLEVFRKLVAAEVPGTLVGTLAGRLLSGE